MCKNDKLNAILAFNSELSRTKEEAFASEKTQAFFLDKKGKAYVRGNFPIGTIVNTAKDIPFSDVEEVKLGMHLSIPKIPLNVLQQVVSFFRDVCQDTKDEAFVRIYLEKDTNEYIIHCPKQSISGASVKYEITDEHLENDCIVVMDIHSHNTMNAFFSGTDDGDEKNPGQLFMVLGHLNTHNIEFKLRTFMDEYIPVDFFDVFERPEISITIGNEKLEMSLSDDTVINGIFETVVDYPEEWKSNLIKRTYATSFTGGQQLAFFGCDDVSIGSGRSYPAHKSYSPTRFNNDEDEDDFVEKFSGKFSGVNMSVDDEEYDCSDMPSTSSIDADYEKGVDAGIAVTDDMDQQNQFFVSGLVDGLEQAGILEDVIEVLKKNRLI